VLQSKVPYAKTAELGRYISPIFEELNWAYSSAVSANLLRGAFCLLTIIQPVQAGTGSSGNASYYDLTPAGLQVRCVFAADHQGISDCTAAAFDFFETGTRPDEKMLENAEWWRLQQQQQEQEQQEEQEQTKKQKPKQQQQKQQQQHQKQEQQPPQ
jgi:hypothetical protein